MTDTLNIPNREWHRAEERTGASPCTGICSVAAGDSVCRGCYRTLDDIARWATAPAAERQQRLAHRQALICATAERYFELVDAERLMQQWQRYLARPPYPRFPWEAWLHLCQKGASRIQDLSAYGVRARSRHAAEAPSRLWRCWKDDLVRARRSSGFVEELFGETDEGVMGGCRTADGVN